jgi:hypothetical protein
MTRERRRAMLGIGKEVRSMTLTRKDFLAAGLTAVAVLVFLATHEGWNVALVGGSHRWAAGVILLLGLVACGLGSPERSATTAICATLGSVALILGVAGIVTGSLTLVSLLVVDTVLLLVIATLGHVRHTGVKRRSLPC